MGIISTVGRNSFKVRMLLWGIGTVLLLGAATMIYPFGLMIAGSSKTPVDAAENRLIPSFLTDDEAYYRKVMEAFFNEREIQFRQTYRIDADTFAQLSPPESPSSGLVADWLEFLRRNPYPPRCYTPAFCSVRTSNRTQPLLLRKFKRQLQEKYRSVEALNRELQTSFRSWDEFSVQTPVFDLRTSVPERNRFRAAFEAFSETLPPELRSYTLPEGCYVKSYLQILYTDSIAAYNRTHRTAYASWDQVGLPAACPERGTGPERRDWETFMRELLNPIWIRLAPAELPAYRRYLEARHGRISALNSLYGSNYREFSELPLPEPATLGGAALTDYTEYIQGWSSPAGGIRHRAALSSLQPDGPEFGFRRFLRRKYGTLEALNRQLDTHFSDWSRIWPPQRELHAGHVMAHKAGYRREFAVRNFIAVAESVILQDRVMFNTFLYCALAVLGALIVNPAAAYALSRFRPPSTYRLLLFMMVTMAFPPMVTQIPSFLMLREFGLLNSYAALILPGLANGYSIFLLKGFFDSLPKELYESAMLDGAGEVRIFFQFTMSLSKPILAVTALGAFTGAYGNFMMALLVCQDRKMWTLMPWLYQLQMNSGPGIVFASLLVAAIPTFLVFLCCQNVIMRGIVVPVEK